MKTLKSIITFALVIILALGCLITPAWAETGFHYDKTATVYMTSASYGWVYLHIGRGSSAKVSGVTSSNKAVARVVQIQNSNLSIGSRYYDEEGNSYTDSNDDTYYTNIYLVCNKPGTTTVKFTYNGKTYSTKVTVKAYVNPAKSMTISYVSGGANVASVFSQENYFSGLKMSRSSSQGRIKVTAKDGWKITGIYIEDTENMNVMTKSYNTKVKSTSFYYGPMKASHVYFAYITFKNINNGGTIELQFRINGDPIYA